MIERESRTQFRTDLFSGRAEYYDRYRPPYPTALIDHLCAHVPLTASSTVVDLACGTGQITFALAAHVAEVVAIDQEAEAVTFGQSKAEHLGITNLHWGVGIAEGVHFDTTVDLVAIGNAFHRFDRDAATRNLVSQLRVGGCIALLWGDPPWSRDVEWQRRLEHTVDRWRDILDVRDRVPPGWEAAMASDPHEQVLRRAGLRYEGTFDFPVDLRWTVDSLIGFVYSTSVLNRTVLGDHAGAFERDLRDDLLACSADDTFDQHATFALQLARRVG